MFTNLMDTVLVMLSGGLDSTALMLHYLENTSWEVHAHHVSSRTAEREYWRQEQEASRAVVGWLTANCRQFDYSESVFELSPRMRPATLWETSLHIAVAFRILPSLGGKTKHLAIGWVRDDMGHRDNQTRNHAGVPDRLWGAQVDALAVTNPGLAKSLDRKIQAPLSGKTKADLLRHMPQDLVGMTWSCTNPAGCAGFRCGVCPSCEEVARAKREVDGYATV